METVSLFYYYFFFSIYITDVVFRTLIKYDFQFWLHTKDEQIKNTFQTDRRFQNVHLFLINVGTV